MRTLAKSLGAPWKGVIGFVLTAMLWPQAALGASIEIPVTPERLQAWYDAWPLKDRSLNEKSDPLVVDMLEELNSWILTPGQITDFRRWPTDDEIVKSLIPVAASSYRAARVPATLILANVVDNSNVCHVIAHLQTQRNIDENGRYNLLQVVLQVAAYANDDTADWMIVMARQMISDLSPRRGTEDTVLLLSRIVEAVNTREAGRGSSLSGQKSEHFRVCQELLRPQVVEKTAPDAAVAEPEAATPADTSTTPSP